MRLLSDHFDGERLIFVSFPIFPNPSSNRSKYSQPEDVLLPIYLDHGIIRFSVADIPRLVKKGDNTEVEMRPVHDPMIINYSHTEIAAFDPLTGERIEKFQNPVAIKQFQGELAKKVALVKRAAISKLEWEQVKAARRAFMADLENRHSAAREVS